MVTLVLVALGVAMDATAVSGGLALRGASWRDLWKVALTFGFFQFGMALVGALGGRALAGPFEDYDHWIAFVLLASVGGKMTWEALTHHEDRGPLGPMTAMTLVALGVATSVDALVVGLTLPALELGAWVATTLIGIATFVLSLAGAWAGKRVGDRFGTSLEAAGGITLIAIGVKTVLDHLRVL